MDWMAEAACRGKDPEMFFPGPGRDDQMRSAKAVCRTCPVKADCLEYAIAECINHGVWGGESERARRRIRIRRRRMGHGQGEDQPGRASAALP